MNIHKGFKITSITQKTAKACLLMRSSWLFVLCVIFINNSHGKDIEQEKINVNTFDRKAWVEEKKKTLRQVLGAVKPPMLLDSDNGDKNHEYFIKSKEYYTKNGIYKFCKTLLNDFTEQNKNIVHIAPVAASDKYPDVIFSPYQKKCPNLEFNKYIHPGIGKIDFNWPQELLDQWDIYHSRKDFRLYHIDINKDKKLANNEYIFYSDMFYLDPKPSQPHLDSHRLDLINDDLEPISQSVAAPFRHYVTLDLGKCKIRNYFYELSYPISTEKIPKGSTHTGMIYYKEKLIIYHLHRIGESSHIDFNFKIKNHRLFCFFDNGKPLVVGD